MTSMPKKTLRVVALGALASAAALAQSSQAPPVSDLIGRSIKAIGYQVGGGGTTVDLMSTGLISGATGEARVEYLIQQGLSADVITARGFGKTSPVADNSTAAGRQKNRRVELVVSGEVIGVRIGE